VALDAVLTTPTEERTDTDLLNTVTDLLTSRERLHGVLAVTLAEVSRRGLDDGRPRALLADAIPVPLTGGQLARDAIRPRALTALPQATTRLLAGTLSAAALDAAVSGLTRLPADAHPVLDDLLHAHGPDLTPDLVDRLVAQITHMVGPSDPEQPTPKVRDSLHLTSTGFAPDDPLLIRGRLHGLSAELVQGVLERLASPTDTHDPTATRDAAEQPQPRAERLAAALVQACRLAAGAPEGRPPHGADAHLVILARPETLTRAPGAPAAVTADGRTLTIEQLEHAWCTGTHSLLGLADPLTTTLDHDWQRLAASLGGLLPPPPAPAIEPLYLGRAARTVSRAQWYALVARDRTCRHPGCSRTPSWCQAHHRAEWTADNGRTDIDNLVLLCWEHHSLIHARRQHLVPHPHHDGS